MPLSNVAQENLGSPYAEQLRKGFAQLKFDAPIEREFRRFYIEQSRPRGRLSGLIALILALAITSVDLILGDPGGDKTINLLRLGVLCPLLAMMVVATYLPALENRYTEVAGVGVAACGLIVNYVCVAVAIDGASYTLAGSLLVNLYACLFLGLFFYQGLSISALLVVSFAATGWILGLGFSELFYSVAMLGTASMLGIIATYNLEHALRMSFLERCLLNELAERDGLTGLYNRRIFDNFMRRLWRQSRREESTIEIVMIDIDHFKVYNDLYGHQVGDDTLKRVAQCIARCAKRPFDFCARYGGEEFVLVLYNPPAEFAQSVPEQIRQSIMELAIPHEGSQSASFVTVSIGVAVARPGSGRSLMGAIQAADEALYEAKRIGRNRVVVKDANISEVETGKFRAAKYELA
jgi:diguanylate cyclase (GGDEF)-like protein